MARLARWVGIGAVVIVAFAALAVFGQFNTCACSQPAATPFPSSPVVGVVVAVESTGLSNVTGFTLNDGSGWLYHFSLGPLENATEFSPSHLAEHQLTSEPIRAFFRFEDGNAVVYRLEDAST